MSDYSIETRQLTHYFGRDEKVLDNICLQVPKGAVYGFLGPNGAGKTTTLRLLLGLLKKQTGSIKLLGADLTTHRIPLLKRVGTLIESPSVYAHLTATENLELLRCLYGCHRSRINTVLELVKLDDTGRKKAGQFSLGMKQRLGIAIAMLHDPELLVLDEPTNGLDPAGIIEMRALLQQLNRETGLTILISSHLLSEIEKLVTYVGVINKGKLLYQGELSALVHRKGPVTNTLIDCSDAARALQLSRELGLQGTLNNGGLLLENVPRDMMAALNQQLVLAGISVYEINPAKHELENVFMDLINN
ncbi:ATP-binding cassette domain-containing protein [Chitinophaga sp. 212800010-3]|uniref:ATP-binding cassette domain-containing protein n=1 Tax=unclassified Chitinophaga TaxID=2619133 RepID=UPI002DEAED91|nr:ATP-binding cassette domain-containing protein [Chitinophaga sp. 212800010-3]